jgi:hypothetical protein
MGDVGLDLAFFKTIPRLYLSGKFSFVVTARLDTRIEWFLFTKCMLLLTWLELLEMEEFGFSLNGIA